MRKQTAITLRLIVTWLEMRVCKRIRGELVPLNLIPSLVQPKRLKARTLYPIQACHKSQYCRLCRHNSIRNRQLSHLKWSRIASTSCFSTQKAKKLMSKSHLRIYRKTASHSTIRQTSRQIRPLC